MNLEEITIIKSDDRGVIYDCGKSNFIVLRMSIINSLHLQILNLLLIEISILKKPARSDLAGFLR